ncbi:MAG: NAD(+)/NADH kinase [Nitrospinae bacterium]|nr:NAD(+)/NADH kinase [Nitrospinota bacterium]
MSHEQPITSVGVVAKAHHPLAAEGIRAVAAFLAERGLACLIDRESAEAAGLTSDIERSGLMEQVDLLVVLGGDGTFLSIARMMEKRTIPILGINLGSLGFLTEFRYEETLPVLARVLAGDYRFEDRIMLDATISREGRQVAACTVLNDLVINRGALARMVQVRVKVDGLLLNNYTADGLIVSTPTGSTAYNLAAGGPIVHPSLAGVIISPICPHTLSNRPIVIADRSTIAITLTDGNMANEAVATLDGQVGYQLSVRDRIEVRRSRQVTRVILSSDNDYYHLLRSKLKWGETIRHVGA